MAKVCEGCRQVITGININLNGKFYHPEHFICTKCSKLINAKKQFFHATSDGKPLCEACDALMKKKHNELLPVCEQCGKKIKDQDMVCLGYKYYHNNHFRCHRCNIKLAGKLYAVSNNEILCPKCYEILAREKCEGCGEILKGEYIIAMDKKWHQQCFTCKICGAEITTGEFKFQNGYPQHKNCRWSLAK